MISYKHDTIISIYNIIWPNLALFTILVVTLSKIEPDGT